MTNAVATCYPLISTMTDFRTVSAAADSKRYLHYRSKKKKQPLKAGIREDLFLVIFDINSNPIQPAAHLICWVPSKEGFPHH
jgi:hypothetical protein